MNIINQNSARFRPLKTGSKESVRKRSARSKSIYAKYLNNEERISGEA